MASPLISRKQAWPDQHGTGERLCCTWRTYQTRGLRPTLAFLRLSPAGTPHVSARISYSHRSPGAGLGARGHTPRLLPETILYALAPAASMASTTRRDNLLCLAKGPKSSLVPTCLTQGLELNAQSYRYRGT